MFKSKNSNLLSLVLSAIYLTGCNSLPPVKPVGTTKPVIQTQKSPSPVVAYKNNNNYNPKPGKTFDEPVTTEKNPSPQTQVKSEQKLLKAVELGDYDYVIAEYNAGGLKLNAVRADGEFGDFQLNSSASSIMQNIGRLGLASTDVTSLNSVVKKRIFDRLLKHIMIYALRLNANQLIQNYKNGLSKEEQYSTQVANDLSVYFFGNSTNTLSVDSIAKFSQNVDSDNNLSLKTFALILSGINQMKASAKGGINGLISGKNQIEKGLYKMLYISVLQKLAAAEISKSSDDFSDAEYYFLGIRNAARALNGVNNSYLETTLIYKRLDMLDYNKFEKEMNRGFFERAQEEFSVALAKIESDNEVAVNSAISAQLLIDIINGSYKNQKYSRVTNIELENNVSAFKTAIQQKNINEAKIQYEKINTFVINTLTK